MPLRFSEFCFGFELFPNDSMDAKFQRKMHGKLVDKLVSVLGPVGPGHAGK